MEMEIDTDENEFSKSICDLPEEVLEIILMKVSPYNDLKSASLVCRTWHRLVQVVLRKLKQIYIQSVATSNLEWLSVRPEAGSKITERYSHCCCYYDKSLYVFGGCTATKTTLNDLWRFDLASREWIRPLAMGTYPSPKACASMVVYQDNLVLYGGWSHPTPFPLHQAARYFSELHIYKPATNRWSHLTTLSQQSPVAGHSASVVGDIMVVFGGSHVPGVRTNDVLYFDFLEVVWRVPRIAGNKKPAPRYGHTQVTLDDHHVLILGGCVGPIFRVLNDCWLLTITDTDWYWEEIKVYNPEYAGVQLWCHSACKVSNMIVALSKPAIPPMKKTNTNNQQNVTKPVSNNRVWVPPRDNINSKQDSTNQGACNNSGNENMDQSEQAFHAKSPSASNQVLNVTDQSEPINRSHDHESSHSNSNDPTAGTSNPRPGLPCVRPNAMNNRHKQLEALLKYEKRFRQSDNSGTLPSSGESALSQNRHNIRQVKSGSSSNNLGSRMVPHVLDISEVIESKTATWLKLDNENNTFSAPDETTFFSLVEGRGELLMFGGIDKDIQSLQSSHDGSRSVNNTLHILKPIHNIL